MLEGGLDERGNFVHIPRRRLKHFGVLSPNGNQVLSQERAHQRPSGHLPHQLKALRLFRELFRKDLAIGEAILATGKV